MRFIGYAGHTYSYFCNLSIFRFAYKPLKIVLHIQFGGQYLSQYNIFCYMSYLIMEAWLSSFPMIPISLVYSFSGMNDSFMNGMGVPSVMCQISISAGIGGQYLPQYNILCYMSYLIMEAWLSSFPMIPISLVPPKGAKVYPASRRGSNKRVGLKGQLAPHCVPWLKNSIMAYKRLSTSLGSKTLNNTSSLGLGGTKI